MILHSTLREPTHCLAPTPQSELPIAISSQTRYIQNVIISLIAAASENNVIGKNGDLPWDLPAELQYFRDTTRGKPVIMGRKTMDSIIQRRGTALPDRPNIVVSRNAECRYKDENVVVKQSLDEAIAEARTYECAEAMIIGGAELYNQGIKYADKMYLTRVHTEVEDGDVFFPSINDSEWELEHSQRCEADAENPIAFTKMVYKKR